MSKVHRRIFCLLMLGVGVGSPVFSALPGFIKGQLTLDDNWERAIYISYLETFEAKYAISDDIIFAGSTLDSTGGFVIPLNNLPENWCLLRLHIVKKGNPPASLSIGGLDENFHFIIAKRDSEIEIQNDGEKPFLQNLSISGAPYMQTFEYVTNLANYPNSLDYDNALIEKEFIEEVVADRLKLIADTCSNPLVSLYAIYLTDFQSDYETDPAFYTNYLAKWEHNKSPYFKAFRRQFPGSEMPLWPYVLIALTMGGIITVVIFIKGRKGQKLNKLSVQERKIFELLQKGASNQEISDEYNIELSTVKSHVSSIFSKLKIKSRKEAINIK